MSFVKLSEIKKMDKSERNAKLKDLNLELVKANVTANKANSKTKEIKKAIARLMTFNKSEKEALKK